MTPIVDLNRPSPQNLAAWMGPGLYYVHRDGQTISQFDGVYFSVLDRPERDVAAAYLRYALDRISELQEVGGAS